MWIHFDIWQNQYNIVKLKHKIKLKKKKNKLPSIPPLLPNSFAHLQLENDGPRRVILKH